MKKQMNWINIKLLGLGLLVLLSACSDSGFNVTTSFENTQDIEEGTVVYFQDQVVGTVSDVTKTQIGSAVQMTIDPQAAEKISSNAAVVVNRLKEGAPLEIYNSEGANKEFLVAGQELKGLDSMFQLGAWMVGDAIKIGTGSVSQYVDAFQEYLQGDKFQTDKAQVQEKINEATQAASETIKAVEQDMSEAVEEMTKDMTEAVEEMAEAEEEMAEVVEQLGDELAPMVELLNDELSPVVKELTKSGSLLMEQLEQFTKGLESTQQSEQQAGKHFMDSLLATLEKLNQSLEQGAAESQSTESATEPSTEK